MLYLVAKSNDKLNAVRFDIDKTLVRSGRPYDSVVFVIVDAANHKHALVKGQRLMNGSGR
jgi:hypothetical protein